MKIQPECRDCGAPVEYHGAWCVDCLDGRTQEEMQDEVAGDYIRDLTAQQERAMMGIDY